MSVDPVTFSLRLPADLAARLDAIAAEQNRSRSNVIRYLLTKAIPDVKVGDWGPQ